MERRIGEEVFAEKINKIFDELAKDQEEFSSSYVDLSQKQASTERKKTE
jgi:hypothetical protein